MKVILPIFHHTDDTSSLDDLDMDFDFSDCETRNVIFYEIAGLSQKFQNGKEYTLVHHNGTEYVCPYKILKVDEMILKAKTEK